MCGSVGATSGGCGGGAATQARVAQSAGIAHQHAPEQFKSLTPAATQHSHGGTTAVSQGHDGHTMIQQGLTDPTARARALKIVTTAMNAFGGLRWEDTLPGKDQGTTGRHRKLTEQQKSAYAAANPGMPVPISVMFNKYGGSTVIGAVYNGRDAESIQFGVAHQHRAGGVTMQHAWFLPNDLEAAFSDEAGKANAIRQLS